MKSDVFIIQDGTFLCIFNLIFPIF